MPTPHNRAKPGDYAEAVLLPGDPLRAYLVEQRGFNLEWVRAGGYWLRGVADAHEPHG